MPDLSRNAPRLVQEGDAWVLTEHGNRRVLQPNEVPDAQKYVDEFWKAFPTGFQPGVGAQTNAGYVNFARPDQSDYYTGFDFTKDYDLDKSAKGTFLYGTGAGAQDLRWQKKETAADWFNEYARPAFEAKGYKVGAVDGDRAFVYTRENPNGTWIDWVKNIDGDPAKGETPQLAWQDLSYGAGTPPAAPKSMTDFASQQPNTTQPVGSPVPLSTDTLGMAQFANRGQIAKPGVAYSLVNDDDALAMRDLAKARLNRIGVA